MIHRLQKYLNTHKHVTAKARFVGIHVSSPLAYLGNRILFWEKKDNDILGIPVIL